MNLEHNKSWNRNKLCRICCYQFKRWLDLSNTGILVQSIKARNRVGIVLSYRPARLHRLAESIPWARFLDSPLKV
jgi:hypothetical protein